MSEMREDLKVIADKFGYEDQSNQLVEEMAELTVAINHLRRSRKVEDTDKLEIALDNVKEEIADVEIMLEQLKYLLALPEEEIEAIKLYKVTRTLYKVNSPKIVIS